MVEFLVKPCLRAALLGFGDPAGMAALLHLRRVALPWEPSPLAEADAVWICGEAAQATGGNVVRVQSPPPVGETLLDLRSSHRPIFLTLPVADPAIEPPLVFDPRLPASVHKAFTQAESLLHPLVLQLAVAHEIAARLPDLSVRRYLLARPGRTVALVTVGGAIGLDPLAGPRDLEQASWHPVAAEDTAMPAHLRLTSFAEVLWLYLGRANASLLPPRYRELPIHFRAMPAVPDRLVTDAHQAILAELATRPLTFRELQLQVGLRSKVLANALAALFYAGAITTDPRRAATSELPADSLPFSNFADLAPDPPDSR